MEPEEGAAGERPACPACGEPVEARFRVCPYCGSALGDAARAEAEPGEAAPGPAAPHASGGPLELLAELSGLDERTVPTLKALVRDPGAVAADAARGSAEYTRPVRLYLAVSFAAFAVYAVLGWMLGAQEPPRAQAAPDELALTLDLRGPDVLVGEAVLAEIAEAGGVDAWIAETGRLTSGNPATLLVARKALELRYEGRMEEVRSGFSQNRALVSLLAIPALSLLFALLYFRRASFRGHFDLAATLVTLVLFVDVARRLLGLGMGFGLRAAGLRPVGPYVGIGLLALQGLVLVWYLGRSTRTFYRLGNAATVAATPVAAALALVVWALCAFALNVAFILVA